MPHTIENQIISKIYGKGRGWSFSQKDFSGIGTRSATDLALYRLEKKDKIRRVCRGIYDYPKYSKNLGKELSPDIDQVAHAIARKFGWDIQPSGNAALNLLGLSTQVPGIYIYHTDGAERTYTIGNTKLLFKKTPTKEAKFKYRESAIIVEALKALRKDNITEKETAVIRKWLAPKLRDKILKDTQTVSSWIYEHIRKICSADDNG